MFKLIFGLLIVGAIGVILREAYKQRKEEEKHEELQVELSKVEEDLIKVNVEEEVVNAKLKLQQRKATINKKSEKLAPPKKKRAVKKKSSPKVGE